MKTTTMAKVFLAGTLSASLLLAGCGGAAKNQPAPAPGGGAGGDQKPKIKVAMVTDTGGVNDNSFNQSAWEGFQKLQKDTGVTVKYQESKKESEYLPNLNGFVKDKWDLTWGIGFKLAEDIKKVAADNPNAKLAIVDDNLGGEGKIPSNVTAVTFKEEEGSFLVGVIAGLTTKSNKIGFVGGVKSPLIQKFEYGFRAGVAAVNPKAEVTVAYAEDFANAAKGKTLASSMYQNGADIIYHASGGTGDGVFQEAKERGKGFWAIGVDRDQAYLAPDNTLTSMIKRVDTAVYTVSKDLAEGKWNGGKNIQLGLKDNAIGYAKPHSAVSQDTIAKAEDFKKQFMDGKLTAPKTKEEFEKFLTTVKK
ncbi:BMP family lipoprotein [Effusibacillus lacus]|uniref:BMP family ABC transporter substrate-binding protein n=1 Tax=Effusibacillus lacus TaxID=1348429 RepID=A0A292YI13_9BACL|nr:BMP family ABC transporter substrate-binding protein [Effusibacillus lacus]TCS74598.1 basic membrane protein A [Effusibacillus lacus]GAX88471.1 BMP family ABC transporter substrate-binding protein [Effusibacillus lacus]